MRIVALYSDVLALEVRKEHIVRVITLVSLLNTVKAVFLEKALIAANHLVSFNTQATRTLSRDIRQQVSSIHLALKSMTVITELNVENRADLLLLLIDLKT